MTVDASFTTAARDGCTGQLPNGRRCDTQNTVVLSARDGRRCADHADDLPEQYRRDLAMDLVDAGSPSTAFAYLRRVLTRSTR